MSSGWAGDDVSEKLERLNKNLYEVARAVHENSKTMNRISSALETLVLRATAAEQRQCHMHGEGTDGARFLEQFAIGENACLSTPVLENAVKRICQERSSSEFDYQVMFHNKDIRRAEWFVECFIQTFLEGREASFEGDENVGWRSVCLPSTRKALVEHHKVMRHERRGHTRNVDEEQFEKFFPKIDKSRAILTALMLPISKQYEPTKETEDEARARLTVRWHGERGHLIEKVYETFREMFEDLSPELRKFFAEVCRGEKVLEISRSSLSVFQVLRGCNSGITFANSRWLCFVFRVPFAEGGE